ncbi:MAG: tRNA (guanosine(37)-N1)-methyltransferase TrmD [Candidatus Berkelbacteria bacterium]|nr:tRNA (guanosine(37)-N1)-methyltransferase TrmD [Candidatus Berkelbacteria bacterium]
MKFKVITLFPDFLKSLDNYSVIGRAIKSGKIEIENICLRDFGKGSYCQVDDKPYGGGIGMLLKVDVLYDAIKFAKPKKSAKSKIILLSAEGDRFNQEKAEKLTDLDEIILVCGHYEGFDRRVDKYVDEKISIGDFILSGGEIPAMAIIDSVSRLTPGVLGKDESAHIESFSEIEGERLLEHSQYTRPEEFKGDKVPEVLLSGNHKKISEWQKTNRCKLREDT